MSEANNIYAEINNDIYQCASILDIIDNSIFIKNFIVRTLKVSCSFFKS